MPLGRECFQERAGHVCGQGADAIGFLATRSDGKVKTIETPPSDGVLFCTATKGGRPGACRACMQSRRRRRWGASRCSCRHGRPSLGACRSCTSSCSTRWPGEHDGRSAQSKSLVVWLISRVKTQHATRRDKQTHAGLRVCRQQRLCMYSCLILLIAHFHIDHYPCKDCDY